MHAPDHSLNSLFLQLGLNNSDGAIDAFISKHRPLAHDVILHEAPIWSNSQAEFLKQAIADDADWSIVADQLDSMLR